MLIHPGRSRFEVWLKLTEPPPNLAWVLTQSPDYGWSRAIAANDHRLGNASISVGGEWDSGLGQAAVNEWVHIVGVWDQGNQSTVYMNGVQGAVRSSTSNGPGSDANETLHIGGRESSDGGHNSPMMISDVRVYDRGLSSSEVAQLYGNGRRSRFLAMVVGIATPASAAASSAGSAHGAPFNAFDSAPGTNYCSAPNPNQSDWLRHDFGTPTAVISYQLDYGSVNASFRPRAWAFQGSNDGSTWTTLDAQTNQGLGTGQVYHLNANLLFRAPGSQPFANSWDGWYSCDPTFTVADGGTGKRAAYNTLPLTGLRLQDDSGQFAEYSLTANFTGRTLLSIVTGCIGSDGTSDDDESAAWAGGRCEDVGTLVSSSIVAGTAANLRIGVGDTRPAGVLDWTLFMPRAGSGGNWSLAMSRAVEFACSRWRMPALLSHLAALFVS